MTFTKSLTSGRLDSGGDRELEYSDCRAGSTLNGTAIMPGHPRLRAVCSTFISDFNIRPTRTKRLRVYARRWDHKINSNGSCRSKADNDRRSQGNGRESHPITWQRSGRRAEGSAFVGSKSESHRSIIFLDAFYVIRVWISIRLREPSSRWRKK